ncbi:MAG: hypothetical protein AAF702_22805 [Chloroflexota bacterium]
MKEFARAILSDNEDKLTCEECNQQMDAYIEARLDPEHNTIDPKDYQQMKIHIEQCPNCANVYEQLLAVSDLATTVIDVPSSRPKFDLSFLDSAQEKEPEKAAAPSILHQFGHLIIKFTTELLQPRKPLSYATVAVRSTERSANEATDQPGERTGDLAFGLESSDSDFRFSVEAEGKRLEAIIRREDKVERPEHCTIIVEIDTPEDDGWIDWEGRSVTLTCQETTVGNQETDAFGQAIFENIETQYLEQLQVDIELKEPLYLHS